MCVNTHTHSKGGIVHQHNSDNAGNPLACPETEHVGDKMMPVRGREQIHCLAGGAGKAGSLIEKDKFTFLFMSYKE